MKTSIHSIHEDAPNDRPTVPDRRIILEQGLDCLRWPLRVRLLNAFAASLVPYAHD